MLKNINWKVRLKSGPFWMGVTSAMVAVIFEILSLCGVELPVTADQIMHVVTIVLMLLATLGVVTDPTTKGIKDSQLAMTYDAPKDDGADKKTE